MIKQSARVLDKGRVNHAFLGLQTSSAVLVCMYTHTKMRYTIFQSQKAALAEHYLSSVTPDRGHLRRHSKWRTLQPSALPSCRHCILAALSWLSSAGLACTLVPRHCPGSLPSHCDSARHVPSGAEAHLQVLSGHVFYCLPFSKSIGVAVVNPAPLSIKMSLPASFL